MGETSTHADLVRRMVQWVAARTRADHRIVVFSDLPEGVPGDRPPLIGGYYPDLYCCCSDGRPLYLGEAKTAGDIESARSRAQITGFLAFLAAQQTGQLVLAVPWRVVPAARSIIRTIHRVSGIPAVSTHVLEQLPG